MLGPQRDDWIDFGGAQGWNRVGNPNPMNRTLRYSGAIALVLLLTLVGLLGVQALAAADVPVRQVVSPDAARIAALEKRVAQLESQLQALVTKTRLINSDGVSNFSVHAPGAVSLRGNTTTVESVASLTLKGNTANLESAGSLTVKGMATSVTSATFSLNASGTLALKSALVTINSGGKPAARQGDPVITAGPGAGQIVSGSPTVLIGN